MSFPESHSRSKANIAAGCCREAFSMPARSRRAARPRNRSNLGAPLLIQDDQFTVQNDIGQGGQIINQFREGLAEFVTFLSEEAELIPGVYPQATVAVVFQFE